jgi:hypothetical protein
MAQGHHEQTLGWRRLVLSDEVAGYEEHTSVSIDVSVLGGRDVVYGSGGTPGFTGCDGLRGRQIELEITLATADGAAATTFRDWFQPAPTDTRGMVLRAGGFNPDGRGVIEVNGALELRPEPALGGTPQGWVDIEFSADSVRGSLAFALLLDDDAGSLPLWSPIEAMFPDDPCGSQGRSIGLDEPFTGLVSTPRALYENMVRTRGRETLPAYWTRTPYRTEPSALDLPLNVPLPPPTEVTLVAGEPTRACAIETSVTVYAPMTVTTADGRVNLTQPFPFNLYESSAYISEMTPWVPAAEFNEHMGLDGVNIESRYGSVSFYNNLDWRDTWIEGTLEVSEWGDLGDKRAAYPSLKWCRGRDCWRE